ncbi:MAG: hypothetical protein ACREC6_15270 [Hyphomicrobiaceae bacterium]
MDYTPPVDFLSEAVIATVREAEVSIDALKQLLPLWQKRRRFRAESAAHRALDLLIGYPVVTAKRLAQELRITFAAANKGIRQLADAGVLTERTGRSRNRIFVARDVLLIYNRTFGDEPQVPVS